MGLITLNASTFLANGLLDIPAVFISITSASILVLVLVLSALLKVLKNSLTHVRVSGAWFVLSLLAYLFSTIYYLFAILASDSARDVTRNTRLSWLFYTVFLLFMVLFFSENIYKKRDKTNLLMISLLTGMLTIELMFFLTKSEMRVEEQTSRFIVLTLVPMLLILNHNHEVNAIPRYTSKTIKRGLKAIEVMFWIQLFKNMFVSLVEILYFPRVGTLFDVIFLGNNIEFYLILCSISYMIEAITIAWMIFWPRET